MYIEENYCSYNYGRNEDWKKCIITADTDLLKMVYVEILPNFENYFGILQLGFWKFLSGIMFLHY